MLLELVRLGIFVGGQCIRGKKGESVRQGFSPEMLMLYGMMPLVKRAPYLYLQW